MEVFSKIEAAVAEQTQMDQFINGYIQNKQYGGLPRKGLIGAMIPPKPAAGSLGELGWKAAERYKNFGDLLADAAEKGGALDEIIALRDEYTDLTGNKVQLPASIFF